MNFLNWLEETKKMDLEEFYELPEERQIELEDAYAEYVKNNGKQED